MEGDPGLGAIGALKSSEFSERGWWLKVRGQRRAGKLS